MIQQVRKRTESQRYSIFFTSLFQRSFIKKYIPKQYLDFVQRSHTAIRDWIQKYKPERLYYNKTKTSEFIIDETQLKVGSELIWLWVAIESESKKFFQ